MTQAEEKTLLYRILVFVATTVITVSMAVSGYFIRENINSINKCKDDIVAIQINAEKVNSSRFTATDWILEKRQIEDNRLQMEKRMVTVEECNKNILSILSEIKQDIREIKNEKLTKVD